MPSRFAQTKDDLPGNSLIDDNEYLVEWNDWVICTLQVGLKKPTFDNSDSNKRHHLEDHGNKLIQILIFITQSPEMKPSV